MQRSHMPKFGVLSLPTTTTSTTPPLSLEATGFPVAHPNATHKHSIPAPLSESQASRAPLASSTTRSKTTPKVSQRHHTSGVVTSHQSPAKSRSAQLASPRAIVLTPVSAVDRSRSKGSSMAQQEYRRIHQIDTLLEHLSTALLQQRPANPLAFIEQYAKNQQHLQNTPQKPQKAKHGNRDTTAAPRRRSEEPMTDTGVSTAASRLCSPILPPLGSPVAPRTSTSDASVISDTPRESPVRREHEESTTSFDSTTRRALPTRPEASSPLSNTDAPTPLPTIHSMRRGSSALEREGSASTLFRTSSARTTSAAAAAASAGGFHAGTLEEMLAEASGIDSTNTSMLSINEALCCTAGQVGRIRSATVGARQVMRRAHSALATAGRAPASALSNHQHALVASASAATAGGLASSTASATSMASVTSGSEPVCSESSQGTLVAMPVRRSRSRQSLIDRTPLYLRSTSAGPTRPFSGTAAVRRVSGGAAGLVDSTAVSPSRSPAVVERSASVLSVASSVGAWHDAPQSVDHALGAFPLFHGTPIDFQHDLACKMTTRHYRAREEIIRAGDMGRAIFFLLKGRVQVVSDDGETIFAELAEGNYFGEIGVVFERPRTAAVRAATKCMVLVLTKSALDWAFAECPEVAQLMRDTAAQRLNHVMQQQQQQQQQQRLQGSSAHSPLQSRPSSSIVGEFQSTAVFETLRAISLFHECSPSFLRSLASTVNTRLVQRGTVVVRRGEPQTSMFIVVRGRLDVRNASRLEDSIANSSAAGTSTPVPSEPMHLLKTGSLFGDALHDPSRLESAVGADHQDIACARSTVTALTSCDLLELTAASLAKVVSEYPDMMQILKKKSVAL